MRMSGSSKQTPLTFPSGLLETSPPSINDFVKITRKHMAEVASAQQSALYAYDLFSQQDSIWPDQCDRAIKVLYPIRDTIRNFSSLIDKTPQLPSAAIALRYPLIVSLHYVDSQVSQVVQQIASFREICRTVSRPAVTQRQDICEKLEGVMQSTEDILCKANTLCDQVYFQERRLNNFR